MPRTRNPVSNALRALELLLEAENTESGVREMAAAMQVSPSSAHRILNGLVDEGYVIRDEASQRYRIGIGFLRLAQLSADRIPIRRLARHAMQELAAMANETVLLGLYDSFRRKMLFVESVESTHPLRYAIKLNEWVPIHTGATGLAILAWLPEAERSEILAGPLEALTEKTIVAREALNTILAQVRDRGYAITIGQRFAGAVGIAAPIFSATGEVIADIGVTLPEQRFSPDVEARLVDAVRSAADKITRAAGGTPSL